MADTVVLTKAGPRLIDFCLDTDELSIQVNGPGMLFEKLELMTNRTALDGATVRFYQEVARGLTATVSGETLRTLIERALGPPPESFPREGDTIAVLVAVRATGHHEHHPSAGAALRRNAARTPDDKYAQSHATGGH